jgi:hypothetical protein
MDRKTFIKCLLSIPFVGYLTGCKPKPPQAMSTLTVLDKVNTKEMIQLMIKDIENVSSRFMFQPNTNSTREELRLSLQDMLNRKWYHTRCISNYKLELYEYHSLNRDMALKGRVIFTPNNSFAFITINFSLPPVLV